MINREYPILFKTDMVRAILEGKKTQTRRVIDPDKWNIPAEYNKKILKSLISLCPYNKDYLWVRETFNDDLGIIYKADYTEYNAKAIKWRPSIFMTREMSRITLRILEMRLERIQAISDMDAIAEGIKVVEEAYNKKWYFDYFGLGSIDETATQNPKESFRSLWDSINKQRGFGWDLNPLVWVIKFERIQNEN